MRFKCCLVIWILLSAFSAQSDNQTIAVDVYMYGHSYNDTEYASGAYPGYGPTLEEFGFNVYNNAAHAGAQAYDFDGLSTRECHSDDNYQMDFGPGPTKSCNMIGIFQMKRHPTTSACESFAPLTRYANLTTSAVVSNSAAGCGATGEPAGAQWDSPCCAASNCVPTCLEDRLPSPTSVCLIDYLANDTDRGSDTAAWTTSNALYVDLIRDYEAMLNHATANGLRCLISTGLPNMSSSRVFLYPNAKFVRDQIVQTLLPGTDHRMLDLFTLYDQYEAENGTQAAHDLYRRSEQDDGVCIDCTHPGTDPNSLGDNGFRWMSKQIADGLVGLVRE